MRVIKKYLSRVYIFQVIKLKNGQKKRNKKEGILRCSASLGLAQIQTTKGLKNEVTKILLKYTIATIYASDAAVWTRMY